MALGEVLDLLRRAERVGASPADSKPQMHPSEFRLMCHCILTAANLREAIERQQTFFETRSARISSMHLHVAGGRASVTVDTLRRRSTYGGFLAPAVGAATE